MDHTLLDNGEPRSQFHKGGGHCNKICHYKKLFTKIFSKEGFFMVSAQRDRPSSCITYVHKAKGGLL